MDRHWCIGCPECGNSLLNHWDGKDLAWKCDICGWFAVNKTGEEIYADALKNIEMRGRPLSVQDFLK